MKRPLFIIAIFLLLGAVVNVAVACVITAGVKYHAPSVTRVWDVEWPRPVPDHWPEHASTAGGESFGWRLDQYHGTAVEMRNEELWIGTFNIVFTSYVDAVENDSDVDVDQETRRPPGTQYHLNHYQQGTLGDGYLDGGPVPNSNPPPTGLDVETTAWGANATHTNVDDLQEVINAIMTSLGIRVAR